MINAALLVVGLAAVLWPLTIGANPSVQCRGVEMRPGDVCTKSEIDGSNQGKTQTYDQRLATANQAKPVIIGVGAVVMVFAGGLLIAELRRKP